MRHLGRTHRVNVHWLHERFSDPAFILYKEDAKGMRADIFTKGFPGADKWGYALYLINHVDPSRFWRKNTEVPTISGPAGGGGLRRRQCGFACVRKPGHRPVGQK